jgi:tetratricopeptide (TPR) repeat protein
MDMPHIFISYSSQHRDLTRTLAGQIEAEFRDHTVWWDQAGLRAGDRFSPEITCALDQARAVVVVWTQGAVASDWVYAEAVRAASQRKVVTVRDDGLDPNLIPLPFNVFHTCLASDIPAVLDGIRRRLGGERSRLPSEMPGQGFRSFLLDSKQETLPAWAAGRGPASLLLAKYRLVEFSDIHGIKAEFVQWATGMPADAPPALGRLVHAPAGLGKTRALIEVADELTRAHGWLAGFVPRDIRGAGREQSEGALERFILGGGDAAGLMLIVDYAESRQDEVVWLADRLVQRAASIKKPARLVLLSRGSGVWWKELVLKAQSLQFLCSLGGDAYDEVKVPEEIAVTDRRSLFDASVEAFKEYRGVLAPNAGELPPSSDDLLRALQTQSDYDRPLAVQIAALLHVADVGTTEGGRGIAGLLDKILGLEYAHWDNTLNLGGQPNWQTAIKNGVAQVTLAGGAKDMEVAEALIERDPLYRKVATIDGPSARRKLSLIFPGENEGLASLEPDLIGEHHVADVATDALVDACLAWAGNDRTKRQHIITVLNRATRPEHGAKAGRAEAQLRRLMQAQAAVLGGDLVKVALGTPGRLLDLCPALEAQLDGLDQPALGAIDDELPLQSLTLMELSLSVAERLVDLARESEGAADAAAELLLDTSRLSHLAAQVGTLGIRLSNLGRREEALAPSQEAVDIYRRLVQTQPDVFFPNLATSLNNFGIRLSNLGRLEEALAISQEAVDIRRRLAQTRPEASLPNLAHNLNSLGIRLSNLGRHEEALAASQESLDIRRRLARTRPDAFLFDLAVSLNNIGNRFSKLGRREEALAASQEAVNICRRLAQTRPDAFLPALAVSLNNRGGHLAGFRRHEEALAVIQEAVDIRRRLAQARPDAFLPDLASSLNNLGNHLSDLGRGEEALAASQEAVDIRKCLAQTQPDAFLPDLASSLSNLGVRLSNLGRRDDALVASQEAVDIHRRLAQTRPDALLPDLASSLNNLGAMLSGLGRREDALAASKEGIDIRRRLAQTRPEAFLPDLAMSLGVMSHVLASFERHQEAAQAATEALEILAPFVERYPQTYQGEARRVGADILRHSEASGQQPDLALLKRVVEALRAT